jgi:DNA-binding winged helix-turn-helix (wHTH) protein/tetratricopeptide (TPR) repeat protein
MDPMRTLRFDDWTLVRPAGELVRGSTRVRLQSQPLALLEALLAQPGEMLSREQLIARLWPNGIVVDFDTALNSAVRRLRTALDDHAECPRYIETIPRRGYRFIGHLQPDSRGAAVEVTVPTGEAPAMSAPAHVAHGAPAVDSRNASSRIRPVLWAGAVAAILGAALSWWLGPFQSPADPAAIATTGKSLPVDAAAHERYERARFLLNRREPGDSARALTLLEEALQIEPRYARAWAGIASVRWIDAMEGRVPRPQGLELTRAAAEQALQIDPGNAEALLRLANYHRSLGDSARADTLTRRAATLDPDDPLVLAFQAGDAAGSDRFDEAAALQRRAVQGGPLSVTMRYNLAVWLFLAGRFEEARVELAESQAIGKRNDARDGLIGQSTLLVGDYQGALEHGLGMPQGPSREQMLALAYHALGRMAESDAALQKLAASVPDVLAYKVAEVHAYRGENDLAFEWLRRFAAADPAGCKRSDCWPAAWVPSLPLLRPLRGDPRWSLVMAAPPAPVIQQARR